MNAYLIWRQFFVKSANDSNAKQERVHLFLLPMENSLDKLEAALGYTFKNRELLHTALKHCSCGTVNNERMEFLGDSILNFIAAELIYEKFHELKEGQMSRTRAGMVREETLVIAAKRIRLGEFIQVISSERETYIKPSMLADALEAVFGAVYLDAGFEVAKKIIAEHLMTLLRNGEAMLRKDAKTQLQEILQSRGLGLPEYSHEVASSDPDRRYRAFCSVRTLNLRTEGHGPTRRQAETVAAQFAIPKCQ